MMDDNTIARVHYFEGQFLRTQDFVDEQAYHLAMHRRHNIAHHTWGIIRGLELNVDADGRASVLPGMAVDGYGRELILSQQQGVSTAAFDDKGSDVLDVWLVYDRLESDQAPKGYAGCVSGNNGAVGRYYRTQELPFIMLTVPDPSYPDRRAPKDVPDGDWVFGPERTPPDELKSMWPVFLGQLQRARAKPNTPYTYSANMADRPYAGLVGRTILDPAGRAEVQLAAETDDDPTGFVVFLRGQDNELQSRLEIAPDGPMIIRGSTELHGDLTLAGGAIEFDASAVPVPAITAQPWRIYRAASNSNTPQEVQELRLEMASGTQRQNQIVVGSWHKAKDATGAETEAFQPCLTIADNCSVTVHGNLIVEGGITEGPEQPAPRLSDATRGIAVANYTSAVGNVNQQLQNLFSAASGVDLEALRRMIGTEEGQQIISDMLLADQPGLTAVTNKLLANPVGQQITADNLLGNPPAINTVVTRLAENDDSLRVVAQSLENLPAGIQAFADKLNKVAPAGFVDELVKALKPPRSRSRTTK